MPKEELCFVWVDIGDGVPLAVCEENPTCDDGVYMGIEFQRRPKRLNDGDHSWPSVGLIRSGRHHLAYGLVGEPREVA